MVLGESLVKENESFVFKTSVDIFIVYLQADNKCLQTDDEEEPGLLEDLKSQICDNIGLYASKYEEEFSPCMKPFVMSVWNLLLSLGPQKKYDMLTSNAIQFLASVADR